MTDTQFCALSSDSENNALSPFIGVHVRGPTYREKPEADAVHYEANESMSTITYEQHSQVFDMVIDSSEKEATISGLEDLWKELKVNLWLRLECVKEAALITVGPYKSGKSSLLFGDEIGNSSSVGIIPRFIRELFNEGLHGDIPSAVELTMLHVEDENMYDLLDPVSMEPISEESRNLLKLRWSLTYGTYVQNISHNLAHNASEVMELIHEALAMRALLFLHNGRKIDSQSCHLVLTIHLLAASPNKQVVIPRSTMTFVEVGDLLSVHSHASDLAKSDRLSHLTTRSERSRIGLHRCVSSLADQNDLTEPGSTPTALPSAIYQQSVLTYLLHGPLSKGSSLWVGCLPSFMTKDASHSATQTLALLENARRMHTASAQVKSHGGSRKGRQNEVLTGVSEELEIFETALEDMRNKTINKSSTELVNFENRYKALHNLKLHLEKSLPQRIQLSDLSSAKRRDMIETSGLSLFRRKRLPHSFKGEPCDLASLDLVSGPYLSLQCDDDLCSGRLRAVLGEGATIFGTEKELPNIFISSSLICDYHCAVHNTEGALELELLRPNAEVNLNGKLIGGIDVGGDRMDVADVEELSLTSGGLPRLHHDDWISLGPCCSFMFCLVYHEEVADKLRSGDLNAIDRTIPATVKEWEIEMYRSDAIEMLEQAMKKDEEEELTNAAVSAIALMGGVAEKVTKDCEIREAARVLALVAECNVMATFMDRDYLFEGQAKSFSFDGLSSHAHPGNHHQHGNKHPIGQQAGGGSGTDKKKEMDEDSEQGSTLWVFVDSVSDLVPDAYWTPSKLFGRAALIRECFDFFIECGEDKDAFANKYPANIDPFYDIPTQKLVGVSYLYLNSINYLISVSETITMVNFKGDVVGELDVEMNPILESQLKAIEDEMPIFQTEEANLRNFTGETLLLSIKIIAARGLPRNCCSFAFTAFKFFLEGQPMRTGCCAARTIAPRWEQTMTLSLIVNDDLVNYVLNEALEIELWAAPENLTTEFPATLIKQSKICGDKIGGSKSDTKKENGGGGGNDGEDENEDEDQDGVEDEVEILRSEIQELRHEIEELQRENRSNGELALGLVKTFDKDAAIMMKKEKHGRVTNAVRMSQEHIIKLQSRLEQVENKNGPLAVDTTITGAKSSPSSSPKLFRPFTREKSTRDIVEGAEPNVESGVCLIC